MDACILVGINNEKVGYIENIKGIIGVETIGKVARLAISHKTKN